MSDRGGERGGCFISYQTARRPPPRAAEPPYMHSQAASTWLRASPADPRLESGALHAAVGRGRHVLTSRPNGRDIRVDIVSTTLGLVVVTHSLIEPSPFLLSPFS